MPVSTVNKEYAAGAPKWAITRAASAGIDATSARAYIPKRSHEQDAAYGARLDKAIYTNYTGRTKTGLVGAIFRVSPEVDLPERLALMEGDANGSGQSLHQLAKHAAEEVMTAGRYGLLAESPQSSLGLTLEMERALNIRPFIACYTAESIINWKTRSVGGKQALSLVVLHETENKAEDEFDEDLVDRYRVLRLNEANQYTQQLYNDEDEPITEEKIILDGSGKAFDHIPFHFIGANDNLPDVDDPVLLDIARINIGHFRNSADWENNLSVHSGATLVIRTSQSREQFKEANPNGVTVGENAGLQVSADGGAELMQLESAQAIMEEMERKENRMLQIGAKIITKGGMSETAEAARIAASSENSMLETVVENIEDGFIKTLKDCALFAAADPEQVVFSLNRDFWDESLTPQDVMAMIQSNDAQVMPKRDIVRRLIEGGWIKSTDDPDEVLEMLAQESPL